MHYAQVILEAKSLGFNDEQATQFARKVVTAAALMAIMPEDVLRVWNEKTQNNSDEDRQVREVMAELGDALPCGSV